MECKNCKEPLPRDAKFCNNCGSDVEKEEGIKSFKLSKKSNANHWIVWWLVGEDELKEQVEKYKTLKIYQSARGISTLCLLLSAVVTFLLVTFGSSDSGAYLDMLFFIVLAIFTYRGQRWAFIGAMILWTFEKAEAVVSGGGTAVITSLLWWAIYMHAFFLAYKVEVERRKILKATIAEKGEVFCSKCGTKQEGDAKFCTKCGSAITNKL